MHGDSRDAVDTDVLLGPLDSEGTSHVAYGRLCMVSALGAEGRHI